jgi:hypothetical protein
MRVIVVEIEGMPDGPPFHPDDWQEMGDALVADLRRVAPVRTGALQASIRAVVVANGANVESLDYGPKQPAFDAPPSPTFDEAADRAIEEWLEGKP